jgi:hypothetical protein
MASLDGWTLNKKLEELKEELEHKYVALGLKLLQIQERVDKLDAKKTTGKKKPKRKRSVTTGDA